jgi:hypothetical protein
LAHDWNEIVITIANIAIVRDFVRDFKVVFIMFKLRVIVDEIISLGII